jgi:hypothetical protein
MWEQHQITPEQANEVLNDPFVVMLSPDPASTSGVSDRYIGLCEVLDVLVVIVVRYSDGNLYGSNGWRANERDQKLYWENRTRSSG